MIKDKPDVLLCSTMALIHAHKKAKLVDREAVQELESRLRQDRQSCGEMALFFGGMFLWHTGRHDKAREYIDRMIKMASGNKEVLISVIKIAFFKNKSYLMIKLKFARHHNNCIVGGQKESQIV